MGLYGHSLMNYKGGKDNTTNIVIEENSEYTIEESMMDVFSESCNYIQEGKFGEFAKKVVQKVEDTTKNVLARIDNTIEKKRKEAISDIKLSEPSSSFTVKIYYEKEIDGNEYALKEGDKYINLTDKLYNKEKLTDEEKSQLDGYIEYTKKQEEQSKQFTSNIDQFINGKEVTISSLSDAEKAVSDLKDIIKECDFAKTLSSIQDGSIKRQIYIVKQIANYYENNVDPDPKIKEVFSRMIKMLIMHCQVINFAMKVDTTIMNKSTQSIVTIKNKCK